MAKKLHWLVVNHLFWSDFEQLDWCLWKQSICTKFQQFWGNWPSSFAPYSHIFMMIPNIMGHLPLTEHIKAFSICFQLLGQQFDFSVFCSNSLAYGIVPWWCPGSGPPGTCRRLPRWSGLEIRGATPIFGPWGSSQIQQYPTLGSSLKEPNSPGGGRCWIIYKDTL